MLLKATYIERLGGRKFLLSLGCGFVTSLLCYFGKISDAIYAMVILGTVGAYITGNTVQKVKAPDAVNQT